MKKLDRCFAIGTLACMLVSVTAPVEAGENLSIKPYGFVRFDASLDNTKLPAGDWDLYVKPEGDPAHDQKQLSMTARHTRIGINLSDTRENQPYKIDAKIEVDFAGGFASSSTAARQPLLRLRHAWVQAARGNSALRIGQDWALISGPFPGTASFVVGAGKGNLWMRMPQFRYTWKKDGIKWALSANRPMGAETKHLDESAGSFDPIAEGELSGVPWWMGRFWYTRGGMTASVSGHYGEEQMTTDESVDSWSANADLVLKRRALTFKLRAFTGANLNSFFGGAFYGVNQATMEAIESKGGWAEMAWAPKGPFSFVLGGGMDDPDDDMLAASARARNTWIYTKLSRKFGPIKHSIGVDMLTTAYTDDAAGASVGDGENLRISWQTLWSF